MAARNRKQIVVITGASSGVGRATAHAFARTGASIGLIARNKIALEKTLAEVISLGGEGLVLPLDITQASAVEAAATLVENQYGPIDVWVNNAMVSMMAPLDEMKSEEYERITRVTYLGYVWGTMAALKRMKTRNQGVIVQVGSALAHRSIPLQSAYCGAKHAILGFTESVRCELIHEKSKVEITMVQLPGLNTPQFNWVRSRMPKKSKPVGTIFEPEVAADAILWASRHPRKEFLVGLPTVESVFGNKVAPALLDHYVTDRVYKEHFSEEPQLPAQVDNMFETITTDYGVRGPYATESKKRSFEFILSKYKYEILFFCAITPLFLLALQKWKGRAEAKT